MRIAVPEVIDAASQLGHVHFVGVGGAGLSAIARLMVQSGITVSGSDAVESPVVAALRREGVTVRVGHRADNLAGVDTVIVSTAVRDDNPEVVEAQRLGLRLWPRSAGLASLMPGRTTLAVAGTHGKTTTTAMLTCALRADAIDPSFAIGAEVAALGTNALRGSDDLFVVEADESDGAFLVYHPAGAVVTNVDADHLDTWGTEESYAAAFTEFIDSVGEFVVLNLDDPGAAALVGPAHARGLTVITCGFDTASDAPRQGSDGHRQGSDATWQGTDLVVGATGTSFTARHLGVDVARVSLPVTGAHYAQDALLALAAGVQMGGRPDRLAAGLSTYTGAQRRMQPLGEARGVRVYDSYAHHPTEIGADLAAARAIAGEARVVVAFQPHLVSRTRIFGAAMGRQLSAADVVVVADLYLAREDPDPRVTAQVVLDAVDGPPAIAGGPVDGLAERLLSILRPGDLLITLGAGDITTVGPAVLRRRAETTSNG